GGSGALGAAPLLGTPHGGLMAHQLVNGPGPDCRRPPARWRRCSEGHGPRAGRPHPAADRESLVLDPSGILASDLLDTGEDERRCPRRGVDGTGVAVLHV